MWILWEFSTHKAAMEIKVSIKRCAQSSRLFPLEKLVGKRSKGKKMCYVWVEEFFAWSMKRETLFLLGHCFDDAIRKKAFHRFHFWRVREIRFTACSSADDRRWVKTRALLSDTNSQAADKKILCSSTLCSSFLSSHSQATHSFTFFGFSLLREKYYTNIFLFLPASNAIKTLAKHFSVEWNSKKFFISIFFFRFSQPRLFAFFFFLLSADNEARMLR